jgi:hypothetical protein
MGYEKQGVTGHKLPPYIFRNCKMIHKNKMLLKNVTVHAQNNGWMTADLMEVRVRNIWERCPGALPNPPSML